MVGDPVKGQEVISRWAQYAGWVVMLTAPFLGASVDQLGRRKGWLAAVVAAMAMATFAMWWGKPDGSGLSVTTIMALSLIVSVAFSYSEVLHNSLLVRAAGLGGAHKASGLALALGNLFSLSALVFTAWAFALPGHVDWSFVPKTPLFGLDTSLHEHDRIVAPIAAAILALGCLPIFLFTPDAPPTGRSQIAALRNGASELWRMVKTMRGYKDAAIYLGARMFYYDGMTALLVYFGIYSAGVMKWGGLELLMLGIILSVLAILGGFVGHWLDGLLGPKRAVQLEILMSLLGITALLGMGREKILFFWDWPAATHAPLWNAPIFSTLPELVYILVGFSNAVFVTAQYASSRTLLTRLTPPAQTGAFFGVYALSGTATVWLGSMLVNMGTNITGTQQGGFAAISLLLLIGFVGLLFVRGGDRRIP
jgi:UMF1 family MFS transporter